ncbi:hypothetical protein QAO71_16875 (plasmid) [Halopseudomonas sp. SMJS2]|uniref:hypothetical protein n=1 Tax=Halopseudomonas sp. SMJS2 TaxID=3041098 RepID=UPI002452ED5A|nr:hypothetical protein [Halopseudomonas sp. SMJS2]WGK63444.1 hypothetical protein QAO71_16875 [Halopseudomonas sp. SMJS2]
MDDKTVQRKLDQLTKIANELHEEAQRRYGQEAQLFFEAEGSFHIMQRDADGPSRERQKGVMFSSNGYCSMNCGAW